MFAASSPQIERAGAQVMHKGSLRVVKAFTLDSRQADATTAFLALKGERADGNDFADAALEAGSPLVVMTRTPCDKTVALARANDATLCLVKDGTVFIQELARLYRESLDALVIGVTGSVGKTTTKEMVKAVCQCAYRTHATRGNHNNDLGLPLTVLSAPEDTQVLILEMGMNALKEIERLALIGLPNVGIVSNVGTSHLGMLGSRENIARAKSELLEGLVPASPEVVAAFGLAQTPLAILNGEDDFCEWMQQNVTEPRQIPVMTFGLEHGQGAKAQGAEARDAGVRDVYARDIELDAHGMARFEAVCATGERQRIALAIPGAHHALNALSALCIARYLGISLERAADALAHLGATAGRSSLIQAPGGFTVIDDTYNASPQSMKGALDTLALMDCLGRRIAVLGDMGELGADEVSLHAQVGAYAAEKNVDLLVTVGTLSRHLANEAHTNGMPVSSIITCDSVAQAVDALKPVLATGDIVLVKASRATGLERVVKGIVE